MPTSTGSSKRTARAASFINGAGRDSLRFGEFDGGRGSGFYKVALLYALDEVGCTYLENLAAVVALEEGRRVTGVVVGTKKSPAIIRAKVVVDCTGDADKAYFADAETMMETQKPHLQSTLLLNLEKRDYFSGRKSRRNPGQLAQGRGGPDYGRQGPEDISGDRGV